MVAANILYFSSNYIIYSGTIYIIAITIESDHTTMQLAVMLLPLLENTGNDAVGLAAVEKGTVRLAEGDVLEMIGAVDSTGRPHACSCDEVVDGFAIALETNWACRPPGLRLNTMPA